MSEKLNAEYSSKDGKRRPIKALYKHVTGSMWMVWGTAIDFKDEDKELVILAGVNDDAFHVIKYFPLDKFFDLAPENSPKAGEQRFQLISPTKG